MSTQPPTSTQIVHKGKKVLVYSYKGNSNKLGPVGYTYEGEKTYYSRRRPLHFFRIFNGYGMSMDVYNEIVKREIEFVTLYHEDKLYESKLSQWKHSSRWDNEIKTTEKIDPQYILPISEMKITDFQLEPYNYGEKGGERKMTKLNEYAKDFEPASKTKNIADLKEVSTEIDLIDDEFEVTDKITKQIKTVKQKVIIVDGEQYRVPNSVIGQLKVILEDNPSCKKFKVKKSGTTMDDTRYQVIPLI